MFRKARIKLTILYSAIVMTISLCFSVFIYRMVSFEIQMRMVAIERRLDLGRLGYFPPPGQTQYFLEDIREAENKVLLILIYTNCVILLFAAFSGYFLAGMTLRPIEKALEEQKRFVADASHELRTPLTALQTSIEVALRDKKIDLKSALFTLEDSLTDIKNMANLTRDLLSLTRYQQNGSKTVWEKVNIGRIVDQSIKKISPLVKKKNIKLERDGDDVSIKAYPEDMEKLLTILLDNAVKYTRVNGKIFVEYKIKGKHVVISVKDSGIGIEKKDIPFIFERFYRADTSRSKIETSGYGLGLSIAKNIVEVHKGSISVGSEVGKGSKFIVKLPIE